MTKKDNINKIIHGCDDKEVRNISLLQRTNYIIK